jgi:ribulose-5-phosphate 4-epimerase/fuculose-1-phosphate aldolase
MNTQTNFKITQDFKWYYDNGYITARDGNACYAGEYGDYVVTASGSPKHKLNEMDFLWVGSDGKILEGYLGSKKPSIETGAHISALEKTKKKVSVHVHPPNTVALASLFGRNKYGHSNDELVRALNTQWPELFRYTKVGKIVPFLEPGSKELHEAIVSAMTDLDHIDGNDNYIYAFSDIVIMQRHGVLATGNTLEECMEHIVRLEHIAKILLKIATASGRVELILS